MPRAKASVRAVPAWRERKAAGGAAGRATLVRPVRHTSKTDAGLDIQYFGFRARTDPRYDFGGWSGEFAGGRFGRRSPPRAQDGDGRRRSFELERVGSLIVVTMVVFVEVALVGKMFWIVLTPLWSKWLGTGFTLLVLTPVLSCLFAYVLIFEFQVGELKNIWLIDSGCSRHMTGDKGWFSCFVPIVTKRYITFGDNGRGRVLSEGEI
jgi:hypothetical protein